MAPWCSCLLLIGVSAVISGNDYRKAADIAQQLDIFNDEFAKMSWLQQTADWNYSTNLSLANAEVKGNVEAAFSVWMHQWKEWARQVDRTGLNDRLTRDITLIAGGIAFNQPSEARIASHLRSAMLSIYSSGEIHLQDVNIHAQGEDEVGQVMASLRDPWTLARVWTAWRVQVGSQMEPLFLRLMDLMNKAALDNGYADVGAAWRAETGIPDVVTTAINLWQEVEGFYKEFHAYVRRKMKDFYGEKHVSESSPLPIHLLGSLWGDNWESLSDILMPYPNERLPNITATLIQKNFSVDTIFSTAEKMYTSMGLFPMVESFWKKSMFTRPQDGRLVDCHGAAYDFSIKEDYRIRMCTEIRERDFHRAIHEMGHVEYYMAYHHQPMLGRGGANSAFHEAVGETMVYSAHSHKCLQRLGLMESYDITPEYSVNLLLKQALSKFVFLPWALVVDLWRYMVFSGDIRLQDMTRRWWMLRETFQGVKPPKEWMSVLFDPGVKYHVSNSMPYIRYYFSRFLEHHFHEALCDLAGSPKEDPLHTCCFLGSLEAGNRFRQMLSLGASQPWPDTLQYLTGQRHLSAKPLMRYYRPLYEWLRDYNRRHNVTLGW